ncbi:hypothetical protein IFM89_005168 [Coptis chinensis]|uniref:WPP domain-interacting protein 2 n=1 Tax=Coptis chinensis TaxID=261450 RepID=A0A835IL17_9MAGN|nr:hypothetical protein IFM89_005168 [Coptis chinensis]
MKSENVVIYEKPRLQKNGDLMVKSLISLQSLEDVLEKGSLLQYAPAELSAANCCLSSFRCGKNLFILLLVAFFLANSLCHHLMLVEEIQKFKKIGSVSVALSDNFRTDPSFAKEAVFTDPTTQDANLADEVHFLEDGQDALQLTKHNGEVHILKSKLENLLAKLKAKEKQIIELESNLNRSELLQKASVSTFQFLQDKYREMEVELEGVLKQKIEVELEYLLVVGATQRLNVAFEDQISLFEDQKSLAGEQIKMLHKLRDAEHKAILLKTQAEELEASCQELLVTEKVLKVQNRLYKYTFYFTAQLLLLLVMVFVIFILRPQTSVVVPT